MELAWVLERSGRKGGGGGEQEWRWVGGPGVSIGMIRHVGARDLECHRSYSESHLLFDPRTRENMGRTILYLAARSENLDAVEYLLLQKRRSIVSGPGHNRVEFSLDYPWH